MKSALPPRSDLKLSAVERLLDTLSDAVLVLDARGIALFANTSARRLLGAEPGTAAEQLGPALGHEAAAWVQRALRLGPAGARGAGVAPLARLNDGRGARLALVPLDVQRFALHATPVGDAAVPAGDANPIPLDDGGGTGLLRMFWDSPFPATLQDLDFRLVAVNRAYLEFTGYPESMLVGMDPLALQPEEDRAINLAFRRQLRDELEAGKPAPLVERRIVDAAGGVRRLRAMRRAVRDGQGRTLLLAVLQDCTDEHQARGAAERSSRELDQWFDPSPVGMLLYDAAGLVVRSNAAFEALAGRAPVALPEAEPALRELLGWAERGPRDELQPGAPPLVCQALLPLPDGGMRRLRALLRCAEAPGGTRHVMAVIEDRSSEGERDIAQAQLGALVDTAGVALATFHESMGWLKSGVPRASTAAQAASPASSRAAALQAIGRDIVEPGSMAEFERLQQALRRSERVEVRYAVRHPDIGMRWLLTRVEPAELASGERATSVVTLDVTEQQLAAERNEALLRELGTVLDSVSAGIAYLRDGRFVRVNARFERLFGVTSGALDGAAVATLDAGHAAARASLHEALAALDESPLYETEYSVPPSDGGAARWCSLSMRRAPAGGAGEATVVLSDITRLKQQQAELEALLHDRELMFGLSDIGIAYLSGRRIVRANDALARLTGHEPGALQGLDHAELFADAAHYERIGAEQRAALAAHGHWSGERLLRRADGSTLWVQVSKRLVREGDAGGEVIASYVNVDDRRRAEESLLLQSERTRAILDSVLVGIVSVGDAGIDWMNRSARRMFGGKLADFVGQPIDAVATDEATHPFRQAAQWLDTLDEGQAQTFECRLRARDGREFWVAGNAVLTGRGSGGRQLTYALLDIDRRRQAEARSVQTEASLRRIIELAPMAIVLCDAAGLRVLQANPAARKAIARPPGADIAGRTPEDLYDPETAARVRADLLAALAARDSVTLREYRWPTPRGERVWEARFQPIATREGEPPDQMLIVSTDVSEQRAAEAARLEAAIAQREMLVKEVHHRIKNNLQGVAGLLQQIAQRRPEVAPALAEAVGQVQAIAQVYGLQVGNAGPLRVKSVVEAIAGSVQRLFGRNVELQVGGAAPHRWALPEAESIPIALTLNELLTNALKHAGDGAVRCEVDCGSAEVRIAISNPGRLPPGFDLAGVPGGVSGLGLVRALLPRRSSRLALAELDGQVVATVTLVPPGVTLLEPL